MKHPSLRELLKPNKVHRSCNHLQVDEGAPGVHLLWVVAHAEVYLWGLQLLLNHLFS